MDINRIYAQNNIEITVSIIRMIILLLCTYYTDFKLIGKKLEIRNIFEFILIAVIGALSVAIRYEISYFISIIAIVIFISIIFSRHYLVKSIFVTIISLSMNYIIMCFSIVICFVINKALNINNDYINLIIMTISNVLILYNLFEIKKLRKGISFLKNYSENDYFDILILNISSVILITIIVLVGANISVIKNIIIVLIIFSIIMFITIQKSLQLYYKQKMLIKELEESKKEIKKKNKEIEELEKENINISKKSHTLSHKQKTLEHKIEQMLNKAEISKEEASEIQERLKAINKEFNKEKIETELTKTEIPEIDDTIKYMQSESIKNNIDFELQINGNIYHMINNIIPKEELETLLADHIKNAIIAIKHTNNINKSILIKIGEIDKTYGISIYDSGIEFEKETLNNLGKKPSTTHKNEGGTGMGFMNTFDTLKKHKASLIIEEYSKPNKDNYTKAIIIKFDGKNEFTINSYRKK